MNAVTGARPNGSDGRLPYLTVTGLEKRFGTFIALSDIDLEIRDGEFVCFLGPSGCGKTTLLRAIAGLDRQTRGTIIQAGRDISHLPPAQRDYGIVFQSYALFPNLTVAENIGYGLVNRRMDRRAIAARVEGDLFLGGSDRLVVITRAVLRVGRHQHGALGPRRIRVLALDFVELRGGQIPAVAVQAAQGFVVDVLDRTLDVSELFRAAIAAASGGGKGCAGGQGRPESGGTHGIPHSGSREPARSRPRAGNRPRPIAAAL